VLQRLVSDMPVDNFEYTAELTRSTKRGLTFAFGAFQSFYALTYIPSSTASAISWVGTIQAWLLIACGMVSGPLFDRGYFPVMVVAGSFLSVFGFMMLSLARAYYAIFLSQGICMGLGFGLLYVPTVALISQRFATNRAVVRTSARSLHRVDSTRLRHSCHR